MMIKEIPNDLDRGPVKALIDDEGALFLPFDDPKAPDQKVAVLGSPSSRDAVVLNGIGSLAQISGGRRKRLYKGDKVTITL